MAQYILSDPNFSDGTRKDVIEQIVDPFRGRAGVKLIGYEPDPDFDRLPIEALGRPEPMKEALRARATLGEVSDVLRDVFGEYHPTV